MFNIIMGLPFVGKTYYLSERCDYIVDRDDMCEWLRTGFLHIPDDCKCLGIVNPEAYLHPTILRLFLFKVQQIYKNLDDIYIETVSQKLCQEIVLYICEKRLEPKDVNFIWKFKRNMFYAQADSKGYIEGWPLGYFTFDSHKNRSSINTIYKRQLKEFKEYANKGDLLVWKN